LTGGWAKRLRRRRRRRRIRRVGLVWTSTWLGIKKNFLKIWRKKYKKHQIFDITANNFSRHGPIGQITSPLDSARQEPSNALSFDHFWWNNFFLNLKHILIPK
jgi:hypothetical protein